MKLVLDTSVYIAAFLQKGLASDILILGEEGKTEIFISEEILKEITDKLDKKFKIDEERIIKFVSVIRRSTNKISPTIKLNIIRADPDDNEAPLAHASGIFSARSVGAKSAEAKNSSHSSTDLRPRFSAKADKIIECAVEARANLIVTMDKHLFKLKSYQGIGIIHPKTLTWIIPKFFEN